MKEAKTGEAEERVGPSDEELENVAGGVSCHSTYSDDELCWFSDRY